MSTVVVVPDAYVGTDPGATPSGTAVAAMADANDSTYVVTAVTDWTRTYELASPTKPANSMLKTVTPTLRAQPVSGSTKVQVFLNSPSAYKNFAASSVTQISAISDVVGPASTERGDMTQTELNQLRFVAQTIYGAASSARHVRGQVSFVFAEQPVTTHLSPTTNPGVTTFPVTWTHTPGADGGAQQWYEVKIFTAAQIAGAGFNADTSTPIYTSGIVASSTTVHTATSPVGAVTIYVRTAQNVNGNKHWAAWDTQALTISLTTAEVLLVTPTAVSASGHIAVTVDRDTATDAWQSVELQRNDAVNEFVSIGEFGGTFVAGVAPGWQAYSFGSPTSVTRSSQTDGGARGQFQRVVATTTNASTAGIYPTTGTALERLAVTPGQQLEVSVDLKGTYAATTRVNIITMFYAATSGGSPLFDLRTQVTPVTSTTVWRRFYHDVEVPAGCRSVTCFIEQTNSTGTPTAATVDIFGFRVRLDGEWVGVRDVADNLPAANQGTWLDYEAPPGQSVYYRARGVKSSGVQGSWAEQPDPASWTASGVWIKVAGEPDLAVTTDFFEFPEETEDVDQGVFYPLATDDVETVFPVVIGEPHQSRQGVFPFLTTSQAEIDALRTVLRRPVVLIQCPPQYLFAQGWFAIGQLRKRAQGDYIVDQDRQWTADFVEVEAPA